MRYSDSSCYVFEKIFLPRQENGFVCFEHDQAFIGNHFLLDGTNPTLNNQDFGLTLSSNPL